MGLEGNQVLPITIREVTGFSAEEELHYYANGVW